MSNILRKDRDFLRIFVNFRMLNEYQFEVREKREGNQEL